MSDPTSTPQGADRTEDANTPRPAVAATESTADRTTDGPSAASTGEAQHRASSPAETVVVDRVDETAVVPPTDEQPVAAPVATPVEPPKQGGNRLVGTAWVLLASGIFEALYLGGIALVVLVLAGPQVVWPQLQIFTGTPFAWLPVLLFFLLFELTVLLVNRGGRFVYVVASLIVGLLVYGLSVPLISILLRGSVGDTATLAQSFVGWPFILAGLVAREVMLWTGFAIGSRGTRVRRRNRRAKQQYRSEVADARP